MSRPVVSELEDPAGAGVVVAPQAGLRRRRRPRPGRQPAEDERPEAVRVADADDPPLVEDHEAVGAADPGQDAEERLDRVGAGSSASSAVRSSVSVEAGRRARPPRELAEQLAGVDEVAVVADRDRPARPEPERRLGVLPDRRAGRRVAAVGDREVARAGSAGAARRGPTRSSRGPCRASARAVADRDPGRFLAAVLEGEQAERGDWAASASPPAAGRPRTRRTSQRSSGSEPAGRPRRAPGRGRAPRRGGGRRPGRRGRRRSGSRAPRRRRSRPGRPAR